MLVIPLLVDGAPMPPADSLPHDLARLATLQSLAFSSAELEVAAGRIAGLIRSLGARSADRAPLADEHRVAAPPSTIDEAAEQKASSSRPPTPASATLSPTLTGVLGELGAQKVSALELVRAVLRRHTEYFAGRATLLLEGQDPTAPSIHRAATWLEQARDLYPRGVLDGRRLILGLAYRNDALRTLLSQHGMFESLSREVFVNAVSSGLGQLGAIGLVRGTPRLRKWVPALQLRVPTLLVVGALPAGQRAVERALEQLAADLASMASVESEPAYLSNALAWVDNLRGWRLEQVRSALLPSQGTQPGVPALIEALARCLEGREQVVLLLEASEPDQIENLGQLGLEALPEAFFAPGAQRLVVLVSGVSDGAEVGHERVGLELLAYDQTLSSDELLDFLFYLFVADTRIDPGLLEHLAWADLTKACRSALEEFPSASGVRSFISQSASRYPPPDPLWKQWTSRRRGAALRSLARNIDP
jgi:hypothetical protein